MVPAENQLRCTDGALESEDLSRFSPVQYVDSLRLRLHQT